MNVPADEENLGEQPEDQPDIGVDISSVGNGSDLFERLNQDDDKTALEFPDEFREGEKTVEVCLCPLSLSRPTYWPLIKAQEKRQKIFMILEDFREEARKFYGPIEAFLDYIIAAEKKIVELELRIKTKLQVRRLERHFEPGQPLAKMWEAHLVAEKLVHAFKNAKESNAGDGDGDGEDGDDENDESVESVEDDSGQEGQVEA